ncbi:serine/threonine-protein kinase [Dactylosporangium sp. CA-139114]|uniref:serine/threonine-protein kinase n=1 Tax=Dactylosporangium sp. CA-139114 TaxID=3239931 RepID=UPI003D96DB30
MIATGVTIAGRFALKRLLGVGTSGQVFAAFDHQRREMVAIKIQKPWNLEPTDWYAAGGYLKADLDLADHLVGIRGIPAVYGRGEFGGRKFQVMELVDGSSLASLIEQIRPAYAEFAASVMAQLCDILRQVHDRGFVHRDIKPENIMVGQDGGVRLIDVGSAVPIGAVTDPEEDDFRTFATHGYAAPEARVEALPTIQWDIYSLGVTLFEMCALLRPYERHNSRPQADTPQFEPGSLDAMNQTLRRIGLAMVAFEPERRPASTSVVLGDLEPLLPRPGQNRNPKAPTPDPAQWYRHGCHLKH